LKSSRSGDSLDIMSMEHVICFRLAFYTRKGVVVINLQLPVQSVDINTKLASSNPDHGEVYSIQHYVIKVDCKNQHKQPLKLETKWRTNIEIYMLVSINRIYVLFLILIAPFSLFWVKQLYLHSTTHYWMIENPEYCWLIVV
jgi:hypothetical protein